MLNFMLGNAHLFSIYRLDDILISLIEKDYVGPRSQIIIQLAQQVLLEWILSQRSSLFNETRSVSFLRALKVLMRELLILTLISLQYTSKNLI